MYGRWNISGEFIVIRYCLFIIIKTNNTICFHFHFQSIVSEAILSEAILPSVFPFEIIPSKTIIAKGQSSPDHSFEGHPF